jgi:AraC family transcriptional regulator
LIHQSITKKRNHGQAYFTATRYNSKVAYGRRVQALIDYLQADEAELGEPLASKAHYSRFHAHRVFQRATGETPGEFRRRLLLEKAAYQLSRSERSVTDVAFDAGFGALESFTRAFRKAFKLSPSHYRRNGTPSFYLPSPNGVHYQPPNQKGALHMDLLDHLLEHDIWLVKRMLERAKTLSDKQLDMAQGKYQPVPFEEPQQTLREMFHRHIFWKEVWVTAIKGREFSDKADKTIEGMLQRHERASSDFLAIAHEIRDESKWQAVFVDALCVPPETFSFSGVVAHIITFSAHQRMVMLEVLRRFGINDLGYGDPIEFERALVES